MAKVKITLHKSLIGRPKNQILTCASLQLKKIGDVKVVERNEAIDGKLDLVKHLIIVEDAE